MKINDPPVQCFWLSYHDTTLSAAIKYVKSVYFFKYYNETVNHLFATKGKYHMIIIFKIVYWRDNSNKLFFSVKQHTINIQYHTILSLCTCKNYCMPFMILITWKKKKDWTKLMSKIKWVNKTLKNIIWNTLQLILGK